MRRPSALAVMPDSPERERLMEYFEFKRYSPIAILSQTPADIETIIQPDVAVIDLGLANSRTLVEFMRRRSQDTFIFGIPPPQDTPQIPGMFLHGNDLSLDYELNLLLSVRRILANPNY